jgi:hypothetical protein
MRGVVHCTLVLVRVYPPNDLCRALEERRLYRESTSLYDRSNSSIKAFHGLPDT